MSKGTFTLTCKDRVNLDDNLTHGRHAKPRRDGAINPKDLLIFTVSCLFIICVACLVVVLYYGVGGVKPNITHRPGIFIRLLCKVGLDPIASPPTSPVFQLAFDVDRVSPGYRACGGGGSSLLRVSYHGMILSWGQMPYFCIDGGESTDVATLEAKAEASVLREEVRNLFWSETQVFGRIEFDVEGLGYLRCKFFIFLEGKAADVPKTLCLVHH